MADPVISSVRPIFKSRVGKAKKKEKIISEKYLYAIKLAVETKMIAGGDYYLGKDGRPYYPKNKTKAKPIPVAAYFFYLSDKSLSSQDIKKLNRKDCFDPVTLSKTPKQTVILRTAIPNYVYIMGTDKAGSSNTFYASAEKHFLWENRYPADWIIKPFGGGQQTLEGVLSEISNLNKPYRDIFIVSHANEHGWLGFYIEHGDPKKAGYSILRQKLKDGRLTDVSKKLDANNRVIIRGCNIGKSVSMLNLLKKTFGDKAQVYAPTHKQSYRWQEVGGRKKSWEYFHTYWLRYTGSIKKKRSQLKKEFKTKYPQLKPALWNKYVKKAQRKRVELSTNYYEKYRHPPNLNPKKCLAFAKKHWKIFFIDNKFKPKAFIQRSGPKNTIDNQGNPFRAYEYQFKGLRYDKKKKIWEKYSITYDLEVYPSESEVLKAEKARHPHPEWYKWSVSRKPIKKGRFLRIRAVAVMTLYTIRKPLIDSKNKYIKADFSNTAFWGKSK